MKTFEQHTTRPPSLAMQIRLKLHSKRRYFKWLRYVARRLPEDIYQKDNFARWVNLLTLDPNEEIIWQFPRTNLKFKLSLSDYIQWQMYYHNGYQHEVIGLIKQSLQPNRVFVDVGAHIGQHTMLVADHFRSHHWQESCVYAFEPDPKLFARLEYHVEVNALSHYVRTFALAVSDMDGSCSFHLASSPNTGNGSLADLANNAPNAQTGETLQVRATTLDSFFASQQTSALGLIKADIEGAELLALRGATNILTSHRPTLILEAHAGWMKAFGYTINEMYGFLDAHRYLIYRIDKRGRLHRLTDTELQATSNDLLCVPAEASPQP